MTPPELASAKRALSSHLASDTGVSGVGLREDRVVIYLAEEDAAARQRVQRVAHDVAPGVPLHFEVTGRFDKQ